MRTLLLSVIVLSLAATARANDASASPDEIRRSIERSLPFIEREGNAWIKERNCASCHVVTFMLWSHREAQANGVKVDAKKLDDWTTWTINHSLGLRRWFKLGEPSLKELQADGVAAATLAKLKPLVEKSFVTEKAFVDEVAKTLPAADLTSCKPKLVQRARQPNKGGQNDGGGLDTISQLLVGLYGVKNAKMAEFLDAGPPVMVKWQETNGSWHAAGQLPGQKRPRDESHQATTGWAILALASLEGRDPAAAKSLESALIFFNKTKPGMSNETLLVHWLVERKLGKPPQADAYLKDLLGRQNPDGGWSWLTGASSDAFATGQVLYALSQAAPAPLAAIQRAQKYLVNAQNKEGFWVVSPQAVSASTAEGRLKRLVPIYNYWGTTWAAIGLARSLAVK